MESDRTLAAADLDGINAFGEIERACIRATLEANPSLHMLIPLFEMLYERGNGELWYYYEHGNYVESHYSRCGVRIFILLGNEAGLLETVRDVGRKRGPLLIFRRRLLGL